MGDQAGFVLQGLGTVLTAAGTFWLGRYQARTSAAKVERAGEHKEREQLFNHYNELIQATREMNHSLRNELGTVRVEMQTLQIKHADTLTEIHRDREECRVENERLKTELKHMRADLADLRQTVAARPS